MKCPDCHKENITEIICLPYDGYLYHHVIIL